MIITDRTRIEYQLRNLKEGEEVCILGEYNTLYVLKDNREVMSESICKLITQENQGVSYNDAVRNVDIASRKDEFFSVVPSVAKTLEEFGSLLYRGFNCIEVKGEGWSILVYMDSSRVARNLVEKVSKCTGFSLAEISEILEGKEDVSWCTVEKVEPVKCVEDMGWNLDLDLDAPTTTTQPEDLGMDLSIDTPITTPHFSSMNIVRDYTSEKSIDFRDILRDNKQLLENQRKFMFAKRFLQTKVYSMEDILDRIERMQERFEERRGWGLSDERIVKGIISSGNTYMGKVSHIADYVEYLKYREFVPCDVEKYSIDKYYKYGIEMAIGRPIGDTQEEREKDIVDFLKYAKECIRYYLPRIDYRGVYEDYKEDILDRVFHIALCLPDASIIREKYNCEDWTYDEIYGKNKEILNTVVDNGLLDRDTVYIPQRHDRTNLIGVQLGGIGYIRKVLGGIIWRCNHAEFQTRHDLGVTIEKLDRYLSISAEDITSGDVLALRAYRYRINSLIRLCNKINLFRKFIPQDTLLTICENIAVNTFLQLSVDTGYTQFADWKCILFENSNLLNKVKNVIDMKLLEVENGGRIDKE